MAEQRFPDAPPPLMGVGSFTQKEALPFEEVTSGLRFPEGPIAMPDGSVILVEIERGTLSRVTADGKISVIADLGGGPNGAAMGPDGHIYVCNNGGFEWHTTGNGLLIPGHAPANYRGGHIDRVNPETGEWTVLYDKCGDLPLNGPNDIVFDAHGGFYFTDLGKTREDDMDVGAIYYARADGSHINLVMRPLLTPNGTSLSPDGKTLYAAETRTCRLWAWDIRAPGEISRSPGLPGKLVTTLPGYQMFDSMAVEAAGNICVATLVNGGVTSISPDGDAEHYPFPDSLTTNICFGGPDMKTAYVTLSATGKLVKCTWPRPGLKLNYLNT